MNAMTQTPMDTPYRQRGAALVVSLLFLLIMTVIGVTALQVASLEERISGNLRSRNLAFQAAETALRTGESALNDALNPLITPVPPTFGCANGLYGRHTPNDANCDGTAESNPVWQEVDWSSAQVVSVPLGNVPTPPAYIVEYMYRELGGSLGNTTCDPASSPPCTCYYRITARGTGSTSASVVILQSTYSHPAVTVKPPPPAVNSYGDCHG